MIKLKQIFLFAALSAWLSGGGAIAQSLSSESTPYIPPMAAEGVDLRLNLTDGGEVVSVRITECDGCMPRQFLPAPNLEIVLEGEQVTARQALNANGRAGTVLYDGQTELAQVVIFYGP